MSEGLIELARASALAIAIDFDGTLVPLAPTPDEVKVPEAVVEALKSLAALPNVQVAVISGRMRESLDHLFGAFPDLLLVAEHGGHRRVDGKWHRVVERDTSGVSELASMLKPVIARFPGALLERKTWTVAVHSRNVAAVDRERFLVEVATLLEPWLERHEDYEELQGHSVIEVRPKSVRKSRAIEWLLERSPDDVRVLAIGDDVTDEDMFRALRPVDVGVVVASDALRPTSARLRAAAPADVLVLMQWLARARRDPASAANPPQLWSTEPHVEPSRSSPFGLLVVSNRLPQLRTPSAPPEGEDRNRNVGGLVSALAPILTERRGVWLGWSGRVTPLDDDQRYGLDATGESTLAWIDFPESWHRHYYNGLCNRALWPLLHSFPSRACFESEDFEAYRVANDAFAKTAMRLIGPDDTVWVHDYHLLMLASALRARGHRGKIGLFLHVPFPGADVFGLLPWARETLVSMLDFDLVGFHTPEYAFNFRQNVARFAGAQVAAANERGAARVSLDGKNARVGVFPLGIMPSAWNEANDVPEVQELLRALGDRKLVLGVDRLDYTKGIPERLEAFGRMLERHPHWQKNVSLVQISVPSRGDVPEYAEQRALVESAVGRVNGELGDVDWVPIRYLYRSFAQEQLSALYRAAHVGYVTPLRDGMNLVAKEYVAAQDPESPGVLLLSKFAGAAVELEDAVLTNPWHIDGMADDLARVLEMPQEERRARHERLLAAVHQTTATSWAETFLKALAES